jgi:hypothetical protein
MNTTDPAVSLNSVKFYFEQDMKLFWEIRTTVIALRNSLSEMIPGFEKVYARHYEAAQSDETIQPNPQATAQLSRSIAQLASVFQEIYNRGK